MSTPSSKLLTTSTKRVALITGCSEPKSLGANLALALLVKGWRVFATARKVETMRGLQDDGCDVLELDVTSDQSVKDAVSQLEGLTGGRLDLLVNNAAVSTFAPMIDTDLARMKAMYDVNVFGGLRMVHACTDMLVHTANSPGGKGAIMNIISMARFMPPWQGPYGSSKAAFGHISDTLRVELAPLGVKVVTVNLGATQTAMLANTKGFPVQRPIEDRSAYYTNFDTTIKPKFDATVLKSSFSASQVADELVAAIEKSNPPRTVWPGAGTWAFRLFILRMPTSWADALWTRLGYVAEIKKA
ncbi:hypothetical protein IAT38_007770 [Cryptococcus sp. DSM 104549]